MDSICQDIDLNQNLTEEKSPIFKRKDELLQKETKTTDDSKVVT